MSSYQRVVLIGFRGTGKTTVARELARWLDWEYLSTDQMIEEHANRNISDFVREQGWEEFRNLEEQVVRSLTGKKQVVIDCGGGVVESPAVMDQLNEEALVVWIDASQEDILRRIEGHRATRPLLSESDVTEDVKVNYRRRLPLYQRYGKLHLNSSESTPQEMCRIIQDTLKTLFK